MSGKKRTDLGDGVEDSSWIFDDDGDDAFEETAGLTGGFTSRLDGDVVRGGDAGAEATQIIDDGADAMDDEGTIIDGIGVLGTPDDGVAADPVVGWLVVIKGKGIGHSVPLGAGINRIGRSPDERVALPFGDKVISSMDHVRIIYDDEARSFLIAPGSSQTPTRITTGGADKSTIVLQAQELPSHATIHLSKATHVRFVAFCGESFDWSDLADTGSS